MWYKRPRPAREANQHSLLALVGRAQRMLYPTLGGLETGDPVAASPRSYFTREEGYKLSCKSDPDGTGRDTS